VNVRGLFVSKMPWEKPPTNAANKDKLGSRQIR